MFMYLTAPHLPAIVWRRRAAISMIADSASGKLPASCVLCRKKAVLLIIPLAKDYSGD